MLFHLGAIWRLNEAGLLRNLKRVSSASGGSITAGMLGLKWKKLTFNQQNVAANLFDEVIRPVMGLADHTLDLLSIGEEIVNPFKSIADEIAGAYRNHLYGHATLQDLPSDNEGPRFVINATNVQSRVLWRFSKPFMGDYRVGLIRNPRLFRRDGPRTSWSIGRRFGRLFPLQQEFCSRCIPEPLRPLDLGVSGRSPWLV